jgi:hypothetical protein
MTWSHSGQTGLAKIRCVLGLTFVLSNPFRVPVIRSPDRTRWNTNRSGSHPERLYYRNQPFNCRPPCRTQPAAGPARVVPDVLPAAM